MKERLFFTEPVKVMAVLHQITMVTQFGEIQGQPLLNATSATKTDPLDRPMKGKRN